MIVSRVAEAVLDTSAIMAMILEESGADVAVQFADGEDEISLKVRG